MFWVGSSGVVPGNLYFKNASGLASAALKVFWRSSERILETLLQPGSPNRCLSSIPGSWLRPSAQIFPGFRTHTLSQASHLILSCWIKTQKLLDRLLASPRKLQTPQALGLDFFLSFCLPGPPQMLVVNPGLQVKPRCAWSCPPLRSWLCSLEASRINAPPSAEGSFWC